MERAWLCRIRLASAKPFSFDRALGVNRRNHQRLSRFIATLGSGKQSRAGNRNWRGVPGEDVADLLSDVSVHPDSRKARGDYLAGYIRSQNHHGGLTNWTVALISNQKGGFSTELGGWDVYPLHRGTSSQGWIGIKTPSTASVGSSAPQTR